MKTFHLHCGDAVLNDTTQCGKTECSCQDPLSNDTGYGFEYPSLFTLNAVIFNKNALYVLHWDTEDLVRNNPDLISNLL